MEVLVSGRRKEGRRWGRSQRGGWGATQGREQRAERGEKAQAGGVLKAAVHLPCANPTLAPKASLGVVTTDWAMAVKVGMRTTGLLRTAHWK